jgi:hypothetical protein
MNKAAKANPIYIPKSPLGNRGGRYTAWGLSGKTVALVLLLLVVGSLIGSFYLNQASQTTAAGLEVVRLTREREHWRQENAGLRAQIAEMESLSRVEARAAELGFVEAETVEYLVVHVPLAENTGAEDSSTPLASDPGAAEPSPPEARDWWEELTAQLAAWVNPEQ